MKFEFVKEKELELINNRFAEEDSIDYDNWDLMSNEEILITDAAMFVVKHIVIMNLIRQRNLLKMLLKVKEILQRILLKD